MKNDSLEQIRTSKHITSSEGVFNLDKPGGSTSHDVVNRIRSLTGIRRVGHAGTLDPLATGVLLVCLGRATRLVEYLVGQPKVYEATARLGQTTDTYDAEGALTGEAPVNSITLDMLEQALSQFRGTIQQHPPMYSAVKRRGQPLYKLARQGIEVERALREVTIHELTLLEWDSPWCRLRVACSSGTYIRSLAHDLGISLGCGAHITALRRTAIGAFTVDKGVSLAELAPENWQDHLQPSDMAVAHLPRLDLSDLEADRLQKGQTIQRLDHHPRQSPARIYNPAGQFIGIVSAAEQAWKPRKIFHPISEL